MPNTRQSLAMTPTERRAVASLSGIFSVRMFGLFMILPVFTLYAQNEYADYTATLAGLALGIYGLTQALLQIPFGMLSDRVGRGPVITAGLLIFILGSILAAVSDSILGVIAGRALQGAGAIAAATMALLADLTREEHRTKAMATFGVSIGMVFTIALMAGPLIGHLTGLSGLFWVTAALGVLGIAVLHLFVPKPDVTCFHRDAEALPGQFRTVLKDAQLLRLDVGIFVLHVTLMASWIAVPLTLRDGGGVAADQHGLIYVLVLVLSIILMAPFVILAEKYRRTKPVFLGAVLALGLCQVGFLGYHVFDDRGGLLFIVAMMVAFFTAFNVLEANLPSLVSRLAPPDKKGTALGVYTTAQFLGAFTGALAGGWLFDGYGASGVFAFCAVMAGLWFLFAATMQNPGSVRNHLLKVGAVSEEEASELATRLSREPGVIQAVVIAQDGVAYLKVDPDLYTFDDGIRETQ
uniref:Predicted arabinose efflux permease, MFS family n=1 Tax=Candidatus Kentrum eta TaxID=2126337 RepID=A0A450VNL0_9GAMM|nr:MAG: Predicted arabinose efflux permease, MFS family [Candidatus Kentron sp. H]VFK03629.1 MAG: Predicted arabinose efflux permease, MFS family [Candidatus Kentron sp. H]VFK06384.1 MAG: Predicted arabinose efflux permease, MFS family [Candidatus Kentron sp. H]